MGFHRKPALPCLGGVRAGTAIYKSLRGVVRLGGMGVCNVHRARFLVLFGVLLLAISCVKRYGAVLEENRTRISQLELGMSLSDVDRVMGVGTTARNH